MKTNPLLEEARRAKDELAREAGYDVHRFFDGLRRWASENPHHGPILRNAEDLRRLALERAAKSETRLALNEKPDDT